jgi:hypothetical protein
MDESKVKAIVQREVASQYAARQFGQSAVPRHVHNGVDAPPVFNPTRVFAGNVPSSGNLADSEVPLMPNGWTVSLEAGNVYKVTHNLGTEFYTVTACQTGQSAQAIFPETACQDNFFEITWITVGLATRLQDFQFVLTQINNRATQFPSYITQ